MKKYIFVTGGVCSSLGKGIAASSIGSLLESHNFRVGMIKIDPYINIDAGTMSPYQHGEVYVTDDGAETDLDLGNYARFTRSKLSRANSITTGQLYRDVIQREREGQYLGRTVQVVPHITDRIKHKITEVGEAEDLDITIVEIGGTIGDIESIPFLEAVRQMILDYGSHCVLSVHVTLIPELAGGEQKTKPTQHSVNKLREIGIQPNVLLCRSVHPINADIRRKLSQFTNVQVEAVFSIPDAEHSIYEVPIILQSQGLDSTILKFLGLTGSHSDMTSWKGLVEIIKQDKEEVSIGMVGKYTELADAYKSVDEALYHAGIANKVEIKIIKIDSEDILNTKDPNMEFAQVDAILIPGGFGVRGIEGMILAAEFARVNKLPYFGICLGMHIMVIEYARNILGYKDANSTEFQPNTKTPVISLLEEQVDIKNYGGTMRLGLSESELLKGSLIRKIYQRETIHERHRHRYEVNNRFREELKEAGLCWGGFTPNGELIEASEWLNHPWGIGVQYHPEFLSSPIKPHPLFQQFIAAALGTK